MNSLSISSSVINQSTKISKSPELIQKQLNSIPEKNDKSISNEGLSFCKHNNLQAGSVNTAAQPILRENSHNIPKKLERRFTRDQPSATPNINSVAKLTMDKVPTKTSDGKRVLTRNYPTNLQNAGKMTRMAELPPIKAEDIDLQRSMLKQVPKTTRQINASPSAPTPQDINLNLIRENTIKARFQNADMKNLFTDAKRDSTMEAKKEIKAQIPKPGVEANLKLEEAKVNKSVDSLNKSSIPLEDQLFTKVAEDWNMKNVHFSEFSKELKLTLNEESHLSLYFTNEGFKALTSSSAAKLAFAAEIPSLIINNMIAQLKGANFPPSKLDLLVPTQAGSEKLEREIEAFDKPVNEAEVLEKADEAIRKIAQNIKNDETTAKIRTKFRNVADGISAAHEYVLSAELRINHLQNLSLISANFDSISKLLKGEVKIDVQEQFMPILTKHNSNKSDIPYTVNKDSNGSYKLNLNEEKINNKSLKEIVNKIGSQSSVIESRLTSVKKVFKSKVKASNINKKAMNISRFGDLTAISENLVKDFDTLDAAIKKELTPSQSITYQHYSSLVVKYIKTINDPVKELTKAEVDDLPLAIEGLRLMTAVAVTKLPQFIFLNPTT